VRNSGVGFDVDRLFSSGGRASVGGAAQALAVDSEGLYHIFTDLHHVRCILFLPKATDRRNDCPEDGYSCPHAIGTYVLFFSPRFIRA
jgi:hypothetical protein